MTPYNKAKQRLIELSERETEIAYHASFDDIRNGIDMPSLVRALDRKDLNAALSAMNIDPAAFAPFRWTLANAYTMSGLLVVDNLPPLEKPDG